MNHCHLEVRITRKSHAAKQKGWISVGQLLTGLRLFTGVLASWRIDSEVLGLPLGVQMLQSFQLRP